MARVRPSMTQAALPFDGHPSLAAESASVPPPRATPPAAAESPVAYVLVRSPRARRYILRLRPDGVVRVTIPARGSRREALDVIERHRPWLERQWRQRVAERRANGAWRDGTRILLRGEEVALSVQPSDDGWQVRFEDHDLRVPALDRVRDAIEERLRVVARRELEPRLRALATHHALQVDRVTIRDQRTRWGSCSRRGSISLNWRLVQMPPAVSDYILLHELMHLRQANHSRRFWREVETVCPDYREAEAWLRRRGRSLW